jgi:hypothetical protein
MRNPELMVWVDNEGADIRIPRRLFSFVHDALMNYSDAIDEDTSIDEDEAVEQLDYIVKQLSREIFS